MPQLVTFHKLLIPKGLALAAAAVPKPLGSNDLQEVTDTTKKLHLGADPQADRAIR
jgi:hypothetical protein